MKKSTIIILWSVITSILMSLLSYTIYASGTTNKSLSYIPYVIMFGGLLMGMMQFRDKVNGGFGSFGDMYKVGIMMVLVIAAISTVYFIIFLQLTPGFIDRIRQQAQADMVNRGMSSDQIDMAMKMTEKFTTPTLMIVFGFIGNAFFGAILGLLAAGISSKAKPFTEEDNITLPS